MRVVPSWLSEGQYGMERLVGEDKMVDINIKIQEILELFRQQMPKTDPDIPFDVKRAVIYLNKSLYDESRGSVSRMKEKCNIQTNNFSTRFACYMGMPPKRYITYHRMEAAKRLLSDQALKDIAISRIGFAIGYEKPSTFSTVFKKRVGISPSDWRRNNLKNKRKN